MSIGNAKTPSPNVVSSTLSADNRKKINEMTLWFQLEHSISAAYFRKNT